MKNLLVLIMVLVLVVSGCSEKGIESESPGTTQEPAEEIVVEALEVKEVETPEKAAEAAVPMAKDFSGFEVINEYFNDMYDYFDEVTKDSDDMTL